MSELRLKLFVAGDSPRAREAATNLASACAHLLDGTARIETVDILVHPEVADEYRVLTTPTVVRVAPTPREDARQRERVPRRRTERRVEDAPPLGAARGAGAEQRCHLGVHAERALAFRQAGVDLGGR